MPLASDGKGNWLALGQDGQWAPATRARNPDTGAELVLDGQEWKPLPAVQAPERGLVEQAVRVPAQAAAGFNDRLADVLGGPVDLVGAGLRAVGLPVPADAPGGSESIRRGIRSITGAPSAPEGTLEELARGAGSGVVDAAAVVVPGMAASRLAQAGSLTQRAGTAASSLPGLQIASGAAGGGVGNATDSGLAGAGAALALPLGAAGLSRAITPMVNQLSPSKLALVQAAEREGIPVSVGQATGSRFLQNVEGQLAQNPATAARSEAFAQTQERAINRAVMQRAGENVDSAGPDALNATRQRIGQDFTDLSNRNVLDASQPDFLNRLVTASDNARRYAASDVERHTLNRIDDILNKVETGDTIPGQAYRELDSALGNTMRGTQNGDLRTHLGEVRSVLRDAMDNSISPADQQAWQTARREYANFKTIERAMSGGGGRVAEGNISPLALQGAVNRGTGGGYATGGGDLNELARIGQSVLRAPPDSGTAGRMAANALLNGTGSLGNTAMGSIVGQALGSPVAGALAGYAYGHAVPRVVQNTLMNPTIAGYLRNQRISPQTQQAIRGLRNNLLGQQTLAATND